MADPSGNCMPYGSFGEALYKEEDHSWRFERSFNDNYFLRLFSRSKTIYSPPSVQADQGTSQVVASLRHTRQVRNLVNAFPEIQPAAALIPRVLRLSERVQETTASHDTQKGKLFDVGRIPSEADHKPVHVAAFPHGPTGSGLRIVQIQTQKQGWDDTKMDWIDVPIVHGEEAIWLMHGAPILQICFAHSTERSDAFLAIRLPSRTLIFRPILRKSPLSAGSGSRLDSNLVCEIPISKTGGKQHADVVFNPWFSRQFGIIDQAGHWTVWELEGRIYMTAKCLAKGSAFVESAIPISAIDDGWARILWVHSPTIIVVCTRHQFKLAYIEAATDEADAMQTKDPRTKVHQWILALTAIPDQPSCFAILTSTNVIVYRVVEKSWRLMQLLSVRHFANPDDMTLALSVFEMLDRRLILVTSSVHYLVIAWQLKFEDNGTIKIFTPTNIVWPVDPRPIGWHWIDIPFRSRVQSQRQSTEMARFRDEGIHFASLIILQSDLRLYHSLCCIAINRNSLSNVRPPTWESKVMAVSSAKLLKEGFVADDVDVHRRSPPLSLYSRRRNPQIPSREGLEWTLSLHLTAKQMKDGYNEHMEQLTEIIQFCERILRQQSEQISHIQTLWDFKHSDLLVDDIEATSELLDQLAFVEADPAMEALDSTAPSQRITRLALRISNWQAQNLSLLNIYNHIVEDWITPLSSSVPGKVRLAKEQLARRAAAEIALASRAMYVEEIPLQSVLDSQEAQMWDIPVRGSRQDSSQTLLGSSPMPESHSQIFPTPSATPSVTTGLSFSSSIAALEVYRLNKYTTFSKPAPITVPRPLNRILSHWTVGSDPADYDWILMSRRIFQLDEEIDEEMTEKDRARMQRRAERHIRRQRREAAASQAAQLASSQAPEIISASQPQRSSHLTDNPSSGGVGSSQGQVTSIPPASQVVPGRFGGRPLKKKRKQGF